MVERAVDRHSMLEHLGDMISGRRAHRLSLARALTSPIPICIPIPIPIPILSLARALTSPTDLAVLVNQLNVCNPNLNPVPLY